MKWVLIGLLLFIVLFFGVIAVNAMDYKERKSEFQEKCEALDGRMYVPRGIKGWPEMICLDKDIFITVE